MSRFSLIQKKPQEETVSKAVSPADHGKTVQIPRSVLLDPVAKAAPSAQANRTNDRVLDAKVRLHQKLIEEAPSPAIDESLRQQLAEAAVKLARHVRYVGVGTVEFVFDDDTRRWYFLEMNTRIQVEHPVTEMVTGRDLVVEQIRVAAGKPISFTQQDVALTGHAIECRINAEEVGSNFAPRPGRIQTWVTPTGEGVRVDTHCFPGYLVPPYYDSLLAKIIVHAHDRAEAVSRMRDALDRLQVSGVPTTAPFHQQVLDHPDFANGAVTTRWVEETFMPATQKA